MKKVFVTGAQGLIGKEALKPLLEAGFDVENVRLDLFDKDSVKEVLKKVKPTHLLHFAWNTKAGYLTSTLNYRFYDASLNLLDAFIKNGGERAVFSGTCFEYKFDYKPNKNKIHEDHALDPKTPYAKSKNDLREKAEIIAKENKIDFAWGRIFYVVGHEENKSRLLPSLLDNLTSSKKVLIRNGDLVRDYMYSKDIAAAFVRLLDSAVNGAVNICTGNGITLEELAVKVAELLGKKEILECGTCADGQPPYIVGSNNRLDKEVGFSPKYTIDEALEKIIWQK
jgi:nucleoside-diphosphate-sugar epimerase